MELFTKDDVDTFLPRTTVWWKGFNLPASAVELIVKFSRTSKRKKLLALILLTDPENDRLPDPVVVNQVVAKSYLIRLLFGRFMAPDFAVDRD